MHPLQLESRKIVLHSSPYHYIPTKWICITFVSLFGISFCLHLVQATRHRMWYLLPTVVLCALFEIVGWIARLTSSTSPLEFLPYAIQMTATIVGPTPLLAANFITFGRIVNRLGVRYCRLPPKTYSTVFLGCDIIALLTQAAGGAIASIAVGKKKSPEGGAHIMLAGIAFQMAVITAFVCLAVEFVWRYTAEKPLSRSFSPASHPQLGALTPRLKMLIGALGLNTFLLIVRAIYRTVELIDGFAGPIISTQVYFNVFDGAMIVLAIFIMNIAHPGRLLATDSDERGGHVRIALQTRDSEWGNESQSALVKGSSSSLT
ncbi:RTA1 like protein-domain-containing protein [Mycena filopes]|nr:RTA1 like protein-domain-containing protein [Mycena filopes]